MSRIFAIFFLFSTPVFAVGTSNDLSEHCPDPSVNTYCVGYIWGIVEAVDTLQLLDRMTPMICLESGVTNSQLAKVYGEWVKNNPSKLHYAASSNFLVAIANAFPCE
ncbi:MAG: Rap1a/Tai family immunity protein [Pseudomonadota bacterium]